MKRTFLVLVALALVAGFAFAELPDIFGDPAHTVELEEFFVPDPYEVSVTAGGDLYFNSDDDLSDDRYIVNDWTVEGWVDGEGPLISLYYDTDSSMSLYLSFLPDDDVDTFILVNDPEADWWLVDDAENSLDPGFVINNPPSGRYDIFVGSWDESTTGTFFISETGAFGE